MDRDLTSNMFARVAVIAFVFLGVLSYLNGVHACDFQCSNGDCLDDIMKKCNGVNDCSDGSDEDVTLCSSSTSNVMIGQKLRVKVQYQWFNGLNFDLCNSNNCSSLDVYGYGKNGGLNFFGYVGCDYRARNCSKMYNSGYHGSGGLSSGELIFGLERRKDGLSLWKDGHPFKNIWIPAPQDYGQLTIRPSYWYTDLSTEFSNFTDTLACTNREFQCTDGQCISSLDKCNGVKDCSDGADEEQTTCNLASMDLIEDTTVVATVQYEMEHGGIVFLFCNNTGCNSLRLMGCSDRGGFWYTIRQDNCNTQGAFCNGGAGSRCLAEEALSQGQIRFEVLLTDPNPASLWQKIRISTQDGQYWMSDSITRGYNQLRIRPDPWNSNMPVEFDVIPLTTSSTTSTPSTTAATPQTTTVTAAHVVPTTPEPATEWPPAAAPTWCPPELEYLLIPVEGVCDEYFVCFSGRSQRMLCPVPLQFNYKLQTCDWPFIVQCVSKYRIAT